MWPYACGPGICINKCIKEKCIFICFPLYTAAAIKARHSNSVFISGTTLAPGTETFGSRAPVVGGPKKSFPSVFSFSLLQCSTTCGLGAYWRSVECSTGMNADCAAIQRPDPAKKCHLRPCAGWRVGNWSKVIFDAVFSGERGWGVCEPLPKTSVLLPSLSLPPFCMSLFLKKDHWLTLKL